MTGEIATHRAKPRDLDRMVGFLNRARRGRPLVSRTELLESFGEQGYMLAEVDGEICGLAGWYTEDFIARIRLVIVFPAASRGTVGRALLEAVCQAAHELMCEVALLFPPQDSSGRARHFFRSSGFQEVELDELIPAWRRAAQQSMPEETYIMVRQLREKRVMRPV